MICRSMIGFVSDPLGDVSDLGMHPFLSAIFERCKVGQGDWAIRRKYQIPNQISMSAVFLKALNPGFITASVQAFASLVSST